MKRYPPIGACGLDCGLCPRYYTVGSSRCPGCCGPDFFDKHPSCSFITCCVKQRNLEVCAECNEFPCSKFEGWAEDGEDIYDSFLTHRKAMPNLNFIKEHGVEEFVKQQKNRIELLEIMLNHFDEGRSKSFYCVATTLLSVEDIKKSIDSAKRKVGKLGIGEEDLKRRAKILKETIGDFATKERIDLKLRKPSKKS